MTDPLVKNSSNHWKRYKIYYLVGGSFFLLFFFILLVNSNSNREIKKVNQQLIQLKRDSGIDRSQDWNFFNDLDLPEKNEYSSSFVTPDPKKQDPKWISESIISPKIQQQVQRWIASFKYLPDYRAKIGPEINRHVLLSGPTGSGKSFLAGQFCEHESCAWSRVSFETEIWKGSSLKKQTAAFAQAQVYAAAELKFAQKKNVTPRPVVLLIEEIDSVGIKDMSGTGSSAGRDEVNGLLKMFDNIQGKDLNIVIIATTNYPDALDEALVRPGRLGRRIEVPYPTDSEVEGLIYYLKKVMQDEHGYKSPTNRDKWSKERKDEKKVVKWPANFWDQMVQVTKEVKQKHSKFKFTYKDGKEKEIETGIGFAFPDLSQIISECLTAKFKPDQLEIIPDINDYRQFFDELLEQKKKDWVEKVMREKPVHRKVPFPRDPEKED